MITVVKGNSKLVITKGAYEEQYKKLGYQIASEKKGAAKEVAPLLEEKKEETKTTFDNQEEKNLNEKFGLTNKEGKTSTSKKGK